jgi:hypothetical protein
MQNPLLRIAFSIKSRWIMNRNPPYDYAKLLNEYHDLVGSVRMIRRAVDTAFREGILPHEPIGLTPVEECEAIARAIYGATAKRQQVAVARISTLRCKSAVVTYPGRVPSGGVGER